MDEHKVRTVLSTLQSNPFDTSSWQELAEALRTESSDSTDESAESLLIAAREKHAARGEHEAVNQLFELSCDLAEGTAAEVGLLVERAKVTLGELFDGQLALRLLARAAELAPDNEQVARAATLLREQAAGWETKAANYMEEAENATDDAYRSAMLMRSAQAEISFADQPRTEALVENLEVALRLDPTNQPATTLLESIYRKAGNDDGVIQVLERAADRAHDPAFRTAAGVRLARIFLAEGNLASAALAYDRVLETEPTQSDAV
ncbi:MAG: hypothetical protein MK135_16810, partial [Polyangiaceae bacterium]|nr:hypothetical protein [Polyangiaceae bacterium]